MCALSGKKFLPPSKSDFSTKRNALSARVRAIKGKPLRTLAHVIDQEWLRESWKRLNKQGACGLDRVTAKQYEAELEHNLSRLYQELKTGCYRASPVRRVYIPKGQGKRRPLGLPTVKDKVAQQAVSLLLTEIYEPEFLPMSYGYRPGRTAHDALNGVKRAIVKGKTSWVVDMDIRSFFDELDHDWLMRFLKQRIADKRILRLIAKWLKAGVLEEGKIRRVSSGAPQGGVISPILANIYLHYVIDLWVTKVVPKHIAGEIHSFRYADDTLFCFQYFKDAIRFERALRKRLEKFGLRVNESKSSLSRFGRYAESNRKKAGEPRKVLTFLGFTLYNKTSRQGKYTVGCRTASKRLNQAMNNITAWCKKNRHQKLAWQVRYLNAVLRGHYNYYGVTHNFPSINAFYRHVERVWHRYLSKRSQRGFIPWDKFFEIKERYGLIQPHLPKAVNW